MPNRTGLEIVELEVIALDVPLSRPRRNAFGVQYARSAVLVRLQDESGAHGWGEVFANWPPGGAAHRVRLLERVFRGLVVGRAFGSADQMFDSLTSATHLLALQSGEPGPFAQCIAGLDAAAWDMLARRAGKPLWQLISDGATPAPLPAYASGLTGDRLDDLGAAAIRDGYRAFKLKVGFGLDEDAAALDRLRDMTGRQATLMADANQVWSLDEAKAATAVMADYDLAWLEEPLAADAPLADWEALANAAPMPLAAGENVRGEAAFAACDYLSVVQPDVAKWGGVTGVVRVAKAAVARGQLFCPHFLGAGVGLATSAQVLAAGWKWTSTRTRCAPSCSIWP